MSVESPQGAAAFAPRQSFGLTDPSVPPGEPPKPGSSRWMIPLVLLVLFFGSAVAAYKFYPPAKNLIGSVSHKIPLFKGLFPSLGADTNASEAGGSPEAGEAPAEPMKTLDAQRKLMADAETALSERESRLKSERESLDKIKNELDARAKELESEKALLDGKLASFSQLARIYTAMKPIQAAAILSNMDETTTAVILSRMDEAQAAKILAGMDPAKAAKLSIILKPAEKASGE